MIRAPWGDSQYWAGRISRFEAVVSKGESNRSIPAANLTYEPQYWFDHSLYVARLLLLQYSCGTPITALSQYFPGILDAWEHSNRLAMDVCREHGVDTCRDWDFRLANLNHYNWCFWLVGLALLLDVPAPQWQSLLALVGGEGEDVLLDRVIGSRSPGRRIGTELLHPKPYARLLVAINAPREQQASSLLDFVQHWYAELARPAPKNRKAPTVEPFWYIYGDPVKNPLSMGSYFGRWCIEAAAAVKAFQLDDSQCLGHEHYPGDLLRPNSPSTHPQHPDATAVERRGWLPKWFGR